MPAALVKLQAAPDLVEQVQLALLDAICSGTLAPGQRLTQEDIARQLAVSRQPVLQALRLLQRDGLLSDAPGRGLLVAPLDSATIARVYQVREVLDMLAARLAAERAQAIDPELITRGRAAVASNDVLRMIEADQAFHHAVYAASGNPLIARSAAPHWLQIRRVMGLSLQRSVIRQAAWDEHEGIAAAISRGAADEAAALMSAHAQHACAHMCAQFTAPAAQA
ncbi:MAG: hypothetical protein RIQ60_1217 [Pseudomonadota bacterium]|jgi:DNA-binding GntR family transcriptional regulator